MKPWNFGLVAALTFALLGCLDEKGVLGTGTIVITTPGPKKTPPPKKPTPSPSSRPTPKPSPSARRPSPPPPSQPYPIDHAPGSSAKDFLQDAVYETLQIEVLHQLGTSPSTDALAELRNFLERYLHKETIELRIRAIPATKDDLFSVEEVTRIEERYRALKTRTEDGILAVSVLYLNGRSEDEKNPGAPDSAIAYAYRNTSIAIFAPVLKELAQNEGNPRLLSSIETATLSHEFAHLMGLVNSGTPLQTPHEDKSKDGHCTNPNCLMFWSLDTGQINPAAIRYRLMALEGNLLELDAACHHDLQVNGGR